MLALRDVECGYRSASSDGAEAAGGQKTTVIVRHVTRTVMAGQRIGILGANGQGKSTLVKTIARALPALGGTVTEGKGLAVGYFAQQEMDLLHADDTPLQLMTRLAREAAPPGTDTREQALRNYLGQFRFEGDMVQQPVGTLSGGERARLVLATIVWQRPNLLLLDEPTNHLDLNTREALSIALNEFEGTVLLVSHDRALLREVCDEFWLVTRGGVEPFDGDLDDYQRWLLEVSRAVARGQEIPKPGAVGPTAATSSTALGSRAITASATAPAREQPSAAGASTATKTGPGRAAGGTAGTTTGSDRGGSEERKARAQARQRLSDTTRPMRNEIAQIDKRLEKLGQERAAAEAALSTSSAGPIEIADLGRSLNHIAAETAMLEERWLELQEQIEALQAQGL
jgi:ATP-binding cassette subfamily F protein 3